MGATGRPERPSSPARSSPSAVRAQNLSAVLRRVHQTGGVRQAELSEWLGVNRSTVPSLVEELADHGLVRELSDVPMGRRGRPSPLILPAEGIVVLSAEFAADRGRIDVVGLGGKLVATRNLDASPARLGPEETMRLAVAGLAAMTRRAAPAMVVGVGVAVHGVVDHDGLVCLAPNLGWEGTELARFGRLVADRVPAAGSANLVYGNDANLGALGEHRRGAGAGVGDLVYLSAERGVGGGVIAGGELVVGASGLAGEVGHMKLGSSDAVCGCGQRGCWETDIGAAAIVRRAGRGTGTIEQVVERAGAGGGRAMAAIEEAAAHLGWGLGSLVSMLQPARVVLGGHLAAVFGLAGPAVMAALGRAAPAALARQVEVRPGLLGPDAASVGAAELAFEPLLADPLVSIEADRPAWVT
ncbi:MAG TPA: ROK family protein [Acidimicrobiales bacterium]|nr:ROK family protein [Acidimicrobiales bacterium]